MTLRSSSRRTLLCLLLVAGSASAADSWVDAVNGSDLTGDGSAGAPWLTITHALSQIATPPAGSTHAIHVAPGTYDAGLGEAFPLVWRPGLQLLGPASGPRPVLSGGGAPVTLLAMVSDPAGAAWRFLPDTLIERVDFRDAQMALSLSSLWVDVSPTVRDVDVVGTNWGLRASAWGDGGEGLAEPVLENVRILGCAWGGMVVSSGGGRVDVEMVGCTISGSAGVGLEIVGGGGIGGVSGSSRVHLTGCSVTSNQGDGVLARDINHGVARAELDFCIVAGNGGAGVRSLASAGLEGWVFVDLWRSTVAYNAGAGIEALEVDTGSELLTTVDECIAWGNGRDVFMAHAAASFPPAGTVRYTDYGTGQGFVDLGGNLSADPRFWSPPALDLHLRESSPCVDAGDPLGPPDADGTVADLGALPFDPAWCDEPGAYCSAKTNSQGCAAHVVFAGAPSATALDPLVIRAVDVINQKSGLCFYGLSGPAALPFLGGTLCVQPPLRRTPPSTSAGSPPPDDCSGMLAFDFGAWLAAGTDPGLVPGAAVHAQFWYRDPEDLQGVGLSDALAFEVCP